MKIYKAILKWTLFVTALLILVAGLTGCKQTTSASYDKDQIEQILTNVRTAFQQNNLNAIMENYHSLYTHNGQTTWQAREVWQNRMSEYSLVSFTDISVSVHGDEAIASFTMNLEKPGQVLTTSEPEANGDLSYFIYDNDKWQVYGNQGR